MWLIGGLIFLLFGGIVIGAWVVAEMLRNEDLHRTRM